jgi:diaminohydroxyphosphoribosylaminopyrimidine deaminase/5-amino-6-(5-phosphoribosylamino)uracil reductase
VGAVVVRNNRVVGEGFYTWDGVDHAETLALTEAGEGARGATLYVTMEPCSHHGRTPPCSEAVIAAGIRRVVAASGDPNPQVDGRGFEALRSAGVDVRTDLLEAEAAALNEGFLYSVRNRRPFGVLKVAMTLDGKIATAAGESQWITSEESRRRVQAIRRSADALLTGSGTVIHDDPLMTDRSGGERRRPLIRAAIDRRGRIGRTARFLSEPGAIIYTQVPSLQVDPPNQVVVGTTDLGEVIADLARRDVQTLLFECGPDLAFDATSRGFVDKIVAFVAPKIIGGREVPAFGSAGVGALTEAIRLDRFRVEQAGPDLMITAYVHRNY